MEKQVVKLKIISCLSIMLLIYSCGNDDEQSIIKENIELKTENDSLLNILNTIVYDPIIINNSRGNNYDTISFSIGLLYNRVGLIDSINMTLKKLDEKTQKIMVIQIDKVKPKFDLESFDLIGLSKGKYLYDGYLILNKNKKQAIQHYFKI